MEKTASDGVAADADVKVMSRWQDFSLCLLARRLL